MDDIQKLIGSDTMTISEVMQSINKNDNGILFLVNEENTLIGCVTDGDVRRFLLSGGKMSDSAILAANLHPKTAFSAEDARMKYHSRNYVVIPIVNEDRKIIDFYGDKLHSSQHRSALNIPVVINAGGRGKRLEPFTSVLPKPLIPVGDIPIIELIMKEYQSYECNDFHIIVNYKKKLMKTYFSEVESDYKITWHDESEPLGTGGGLSLLKGLLDSTFFFSNCDSLLTSNYERVIEFHRQNNNTITMVCVNKNMVIPYGIVKMGINGCIEEMKEKPTLSFFTNAGFYVVEPEVIDDIPQGVSISFPDIVEIERKKGKKVAVFPVPENDWMDMGQISELEKMRNRLYGIK